MKRVVMTASALMVLATPLVVPARTAAQQPDRRVVLTFDDLPMSGGECDAETIRDVTRRLVGYLQARSIPAAGFATPGRDCLDADLVRETLVRWHAAGGTVGNHTTTHPDLNDIPVGEYTSKITRAQRIIDAAVGDGPRWFRPPYLHTGDEAGKKAGLERFLAEHGYRMAPVTIDNQEWVYAAVYADARERGDDRLAARVREAYLEHLEESVRFYEALSRAVFGREIPQILLLHVNRLNADAIDAVVELLEGRGYEFTSLSAAVADPAYRRDDTYVGPRGLSWIQRWALEDGIPIPPEPREAEWVAREFEAAQARRTSAAAPRADYPPVVLPGTHQRTLVSAVNGVEYELYVSLPRGYDSTAARYPVVYLLDADYSFAIARNIVEHLSDRQHLTPAILVGIAYGGPPRYRLHRTRDYTPTFVPQGGYGPEYQRVSGGGPEFRRFLAEELIPLVERDYRTDGRRVLTGHSYGGLFAVWTALTAPDLFDGYVIVSPSLWYDDHHVFGLLAPDGGAAPAGRMHLSVGDREVNAQRDMVADLRRLAAMLERPRFDGLDLEWSVETDETHNSVFPGALSDGLRYVLHGT